MAGEKYAMELINNLISLRKSLNITQKEAASVLNLSAVHYNRLEKKKSKMTIEQFETLWNYLQYKKEEKVGDLGWELKKLLKEEN